MPNFGGFALQVQMAMMAGGSIDRALEIDDDAVSARKDLIERFEALVPNDARGWLAYAETVGADRASAEGALDVLQVWLRDVAVAQSGGAQLINADLTPLATTAASKVTHAGLQRRMVLIDEARNAIVARNGSVRLQLERMLIEMFANERVAAS